MFAIYWRNPLNDKNVFFSCNSFKFSYNCSVFPQAILTLRYFFQTLNSPDPLAQQYAQRRRAAFPVTAAATAGRFSTRPSATVDRGTADGAFTGTATAATGGRWDAAVRGATPGNVYPAPNYSDVTVGNRFRADSGLSATGNTVSGTMRQFVATHRPSAAAPEADEEIEEELIDTINASLLSSWDRNRARSLSNENLVNATNSSGVPSTRNNNSNHGNNNNHTGHTHTLSGLRAAENDSPATPDSHDWDTNFRTPRSATSTVPRGLGGARSVGSVGSRDSDVNSSSSASRSGLGTPGGMYSLDSARGVRGGVGGAPHTSNQSDAMDGTPSSTTSTSSYAFSEFSENDSEVPSEENELVRVFENDFLNRFFPFLGRKGSMFTEDESNRGSKKKR